jgi:hypothetical protein
MRVVQHAEQHTHQEAQREGNDAARLKRIVFVSLSPEAEQAQLGCRDGCTHQ